MTIKLATSFGELMRLAHELGRAEKSGDQEWIAEAKKAHDAYRDICLESDQMSLNMTIGGLADSKPKRCWRVGYSESAFRSLKPLPDMSVIDPTSPNCAKE